MKAPSKSEYRPIGNEDEKVPFDIESDVDSTKPKSYLNNNQISIFLAVVAVGVVSLVVFNSFNRSAALLDLGDESAQFDELNRYVLRDFDKMKPIANFLSGLGGFWGIPMWAFYVNRGQAIASFGIQNKDNPIYKFNTAEKAYQQTPFTGFRTFVKGERNGEKWSSMPFFPRNDEDDAKSAVQRNMMIGMNEMEIEEIDVSHGLKTNILYYSPTDQKFPSLIRRTTFTNLDSLNELSLDVLDGLAKLVPSGLSDISIDLMGRTMEAWMNVYNVGNGDFTHPFFHISQGTGDTPVVQIIVDGHFALAFVEESEASEENAAGASRKPLPFIVDPSVVFGTDTTLTNPGEFFGSKSALEDFLKQNQGTSGRTPCSFAGASLSIPPGGSVTLTSVYGHATDLQHFVGKLSSVILAPDFVTKGRRGAEALVANITKTVDSETSSAIFDAYVKQDYLDNILRGGLPVPLGDPKNPKIYHTFSRIHGDIERDYNYFQIDTTFYSQGPGNFRDVNQNRRVDVSLVPATGDFNIRNFLSLVQADGYNPLTVATTNFIVPQSKAAALISQLGVSDATQAAALTGLLTKPFRIGSLFKSMQTANIVVGVSKEDLVTKVVSAAKQEYAALFSQNGFWADHWTYTLDLVDNFVSVFPDREEHMLWDSQPVPFFISPAVVLPRHLRYQIVDNPDSPGTSIIRVYNPIAAMGSPLYPTERANAMSAVWGDANFIADSTGAGGSWHRAVDGSVFTVSAIAKLTLLSFLKFSTLDPYGMGVEMEGGKPGWNDAMNGLPGMLGSGMSETYEMLRIVRYVRSVVQKYGRGVDVPTEFALFMSQVESALAVYNNSTKDASADFAYWDATNTYREQYFQSVVGTFKGTRVTLSSAYLIALYTAIETKTEAGIARALAMNNGLSPTYFYYDCTEYEIIPPAPYTPPALAPPTQVVAKAFAVKTLPNFLEGPTRQFKIVSDTNTRNQIYQLTKASALYDSKLKMFTLSESLASMGQSIGRMKAFSAGWLENQSVWLHMSYKFYLELLRAGLYDAFFTEIKTGLVPFMNNKVYGRSPLEASSFIVSSAFPDPKLHGAGFLARLSGSTAEFLSMWIFMMAGPNPFYVDSAGALALKLSPVIPGWMFTEDNTVSFTFLGAVEVTYLNPTRADTWKVQASSVVVTAKDGSVYQFNGAIITQDVALMVRDLDVQSIVVTF